jgi:hypothetical protein
MKNKTLLLCCMLMLNIQVMFSQHSITAYPPPTDFRFEDLWHFTATSTSSNYVEFYVSLRVFDESNNLLIKSNSSTFSLSSGSLYINPMSLNTISPLNTLYYNNFYAGVVGAGDFFPSGTYNIVFNLLGKPLDGEFDELAESSYQAIVDLFIPPLLVYPEDFDTIDIPNPTLTWLPAFQSNSTATILYDLKLVEMYAGQTSAQAIAANPVHLSQTGLPLTALPYPVGGSALELNHTYSWQVVATVNGNPIGYSQIWQFTYAIDSIPEDTTIYHRQFYSLFDNNFASPAIINTDVIPMKVEERYFNADQYLKFKIYDMNNALIGSSDNLSIQLMNGVHFIQISLCNTFSFQENSEYTVEIINSKEEKLYLKFINKFNNSHCE